MPTDRHLEMAAEGCRMCLGAGSIPVVSATRPIASCPECSRVAALIEQAEERGRRRICELLEDRLLEETGYENDETSTEGMREIAGFKADVLNDMLCRAALKETQP